jgi:hypothetical protein
MITSASGVPKARSAARCWTRRPGRGRICLDELINEYIGFDDRMPRILVIDDDDMVRDTIESWNGPAMR